MKCRGCNSDVSNVFVDLGESPIANNLISIENDKFSNVYYPLKVFVCDFCLLVQLPNLFSESEIFKDDYTYLSSYSQSWLEHCEFFVTEILKIIEFKKNDLVIEVASNDGYLLQYFLNKNIEVLGIEPTRSAANYALDKKIPTIIEFFGTELAHTLQKKNISPKLIIANNVLAHVPNLVDFIEGLSVLATEDTLITIEFPTVHNLIKNNQFDTIYHEHYSYLSISALLPILNRFFLSIVNLEKITTHGGSFRLYLKKNSKNIKNYSIESILKEELTLDPRHKSVQIDFLAKIEQVKNDLLSELNTLKSKGAVIAAYGAAAKGNTLLNYCGIDSTKISYVIDRNPIKQGKKLPGSLIPVHSEEFLEINPPDVILILPWNLSSEILSQLDWLKNNGTKFIRAIPRLEYL
jgi:hypothetical protein